MLKRYIPLYFGKFVIPSYTFVNFPMILLNLAYVFFALFTWFSFPPTLTIMHHTMHALAPPLKIKTHRLIKESRLRGI